MCKTIGVGGREIASVAGLRKLVGADNIVLDARFAPAGFLKDTENYCLCPVDVEATAARAGYACEDDGCGDYVWTHPGELARLRAEIARWKEKV